MLGLIVLLIFGRICAGDIPACHTAHLHGLALPHGHAQLLIQMVSQLYISLFIASIPLGWIVARLTSLDTDQFTGGKQRGEAQLR